MELVTQLISLWVKTWLPGLQNSLKVVRMSVALEQEGKENIGSAVQEEKDEKTRYFLEFCLTYQLLNVEERPQFF
jgi:hypothetical protein